MVNERFGINIGRQKLREIYRTHRIRYMMPHTTVRLSEGKELQRIRDRIEFSVQIDRLQRRGCDIIYMDETTF